MKLDIRLLIPGLPFDPKDPFAKSLGGSETAGIQLAHALGNLGHTVAAFASVEQPWTEGSVTFLPAQNFEPTQSSVPSDLCIVQRVPVGLSRKFESKVNFLWVHDLLFARRQPELAGAMHNIDRIVTVSGFQRDQWREVMPSLPEESFLVSRNGIDLDLIDKAAIDPPVRERKLIVCGARPERGIDVLLTQVYPRILKNHPDVRLALAAYDCPNPAIQPLYDDLKRIAGQFGERVEWHGALNKHDLYRLYQRAGLYLYPTPSPGDAVFRETSCVVGSTLVDMPRDYRQHPDGVPIAELAGKSGFPVYCYDATAEQMTLSTCKWVAKTRRAAEVWKLTLDDGSTLRATPDHRIMRRDGTWVELKDLLIGESLMPLYKHHRVVVNRNNGRWVDEARLVGEWQAGRSLDGRNEHVHHKNGWWDNSPDNLQVLSRSEHFSLTHKGKKQPPLAIKRQKASLRSFLDGLDESHRALFFAKRPAAARALWRKVRDMPEAERTAWLADRASKADRSTKVYRDAQRPRGKELASGLWDRVNCLPADERQAWMAARTEAMREARWNHSVVSIEPDGVEDVYDMEVETHHNFVANGIVIHNCISAMEAMACGCPVVASRRGGLIETIENYGVLVDFESEHAATEEAVTKFVAAASKLLDGQGWHDIQGNALAHSRSLDWTPVAEEMVEEAHRILRNESSDPVRLARHFIRRQDPEAAKATFAAVRDTAIFPPQPAEKLAELDEIETWLTERYAHTESFDKLANFYATSIGPNNNHVFEGLMQAPDSRFNDQCFSRFQLIDTAIRRLAGLPSEPVMLAEAYNGKPPRPLSILDFGCSQGECPISLHNRLGARILGIDASPDEIERARKLAQAKAKRPNVVNFETGNEADFSAVDDYVALHGRFDVLVMAEVIEHLINPIATIERLEKKVREGGVIVLTIPYGPWETQRPEPLRGQHLREWSAADVREIFRGKESLIMDSAPSQVCPVSGDVLGNLYVSYKANGKPLCPIDWSRKLCSQRPRQTLSACMMLGGPHDHQTLHWCLEPVRAIADEIVIADTGMTDEAKRIAVQYGAIIIPDCPSPLQVGFDVSRNLALDRCRSDWVIMIDGDERLLTPPALWPYLRENMYWSYAVRQHHFAVDANWKPDMPGRIFRRRPDSQGRVIRHVGKLHEHPEFGVNQGAGNATLLQNVHLAHVGYLETQTRANRFVRNLPLLRYDLEVNPDRELTQLVVCRDSMINARFNLAKMGINADEPGSALRVPECTQLARDVVGIWEKYFSTNTGPMSHEAMEFYNDACRMLGADVVADGLNVQRQGIGQPVGPGAKFFWSIDHYQRWLATRTKMATDPLIGAGY